MNKTFILALTIAAVSFGCTEDEKEATPSLTNEVVAPATTDQAQADTATIAPENDATATDEKKMTDTDANTTETEVETEAVEAPVK